MVTAALAWILKSWYGLLMPNRQRGLVFYTLLCYCRLRLYAVGADPLPYYGLQQLLKRLFAIWEKLRLMAPA